MLPSVISRDNCVFYQREPRHATACHGCFERPSGRRPLPLRLPLPPPLCVPRPLPVSVPSPSLLPVSVPSPPMMPPPMCPWRFALALAAANDAHPRGNVLRREQELPHEFCPIIGNGSIVVWWIRVHLRHCSSVVSAVTRRGIHQWWRRVLNDGQIDDGAVVHPKIQEC